MRPNERSHPGRPRTAPLALVCLAAVAAAPAAAQPALTAASYFSCQIAAREATLTGLAERVALLQQQASDLSQRQSDDRTRDLVTARLAACGFGLNVLSAYAHQHRDALVAWLAANPKVQVQLDDLSTKMAALSAQIPAPGAPNRQPVRRVPQGVGS